MCPSLANCFINCNVSFITIMVNTMLTSFQTIVLMAYRYCLMRFYPIVYLEIHVTLYFSNIVQNLNLHFDHSFCKINLQSMKIVTYVHVYKQAVLIYLCS